MSIFSERLKNLRQSFSLTQPELADKIGVSRSTISMYEQGAREPDFETLEAIADFFNVDMNYLTGKTVDIPDEIIILNRAAKKMTPEQRKKLLKMAEMWFEEEFKEDD